MSFKYTQVEAIPSLWHNPYENFKNHTTSNQIIIQSESFWVPKNQALDSIFCLRILFELWVSDYVQSKTILKIISIFWTRIKEISKSENLEKVNLTKSSSMKLHFALEFPLLIIQAFKYVMQFRDHQICIWLNAKKLMTN